MRKALIWLLSESQIFGLAQLQKIRMELQLQWSDQLERRKGDKNMLEAPEVLSSLCRVKPSISVRCGYLCPNTRCAPVQVLIMLSFSYLFVISSDHINAPSRIWSLTNWYVYWVRSPSLLSLNRWIFGLSKRCHLYRGNAVGLIFLPIPLNGLGYKGGLFWY